MRIPIMAAVVLLLLPLCAEEKQPAQKFEIPDPTNLKVLKVATGAEVVQIMFTFTTGLGVECTYCHVEGHFASDENPKKDTARQMIQLVQRINADFPDSKMHVSCYTCHRGETVPKTAAEPKPGQ